MTSIDIRAGTFQWVDKEEMLSGLGLKEASAVSDLFISMGALYGVQLSNDSAATFDSVCKDGKAVSDCLIQTGNPQLLLNLQLMKLIHQISPILNTDCQLDCLSSENRQYFGTAMLREIMGLCFNDEIYFHLSKGLLP